MSPVVSSKMPGSLRFPASGLQDVKRPRPEQNPSYIPQNSTPSMHHKSEVSKTQSAGLGASAGFTLVELLVSVTIIIVLAALVFVVTGTIRSKAQQANAINSLRQVGVGHVAYATENNGAINHLRDTGETKEEGGPNAWVSNTFWGRMQPYLFSGIETNNQAQLQRQIKAALNLLFNSSDADTMAGTPFSGIRKYGDLSGLPVPLAFNVSIRAPWNQPSRRLSALGDPSRILYCTYGRYFFNKTHGNTYLPMPEPGVARQGIFYLNNRQAIVCFLDGHVEMISPPFPDRMYQ
jgi:prepilin-type processing-associated H-X9-DG protein